MIYRVSRINLLPFLQLAMMKVKPLVLFAVTMTVLVKNGVSFGENHLYRLIKMRNALSTEQDASFRPWMALLQKQAMGVAQRPHCSAFFINRHPLNFLPSINNDESDILLTSRECVLRERPLNNTDRLMVLLGEFVNASVAVKSIVSNKHIAIIKLEKPVKFTKNMELLSSSLSMMRWRYFCYAFVNSWAEENSTGKPILHHNLKAARVDHLIDKGEFIQGKWLGKNKLSIGSPLIRETVLHGTNILGVYHGTANEVDNHLFSSIPYNMQWIIDSTTRMDKQSDSIYYDDPYELITIPKPPPYDFNDPHSETIKTYGREFNSPFPFEIRPIDHDLTFNGQADLDDVVEQEGFHFADVINYTIVHTPKQCMMACLLAVPQCKAVNYVYNNMWCVFLASAHKIEDNVFVGVQVFWEKIPDSKHMYFTTGPKSNPPRYTPRVDGLGKQLPTGMAPRFRRKSKRVIGGTISDQFVYPWMVDLGHCGGSLIESDLRNDGNRSESDLIITAAHCVLEQGTSQTLLPNLHIKLGSTRIGVVESTEQWRKALKIVSHSEFLWYQDHFTNDIAIIQLDQPVEYSDYIGPLRLPDEFSSAESSNNCKSIGWGKTEYGEETAYLKEIPLQVSQCRADQLFVGQFFCAKHVHILGNICKGDSGGPFFCSTQLKDGRSISTLSGIIVSVNFKSDGISCDPNGTSLFADVPNLLHWIRDAKDRMMKMSNGTHDFV